MNFAGHKWVHSEARVSSGQKLLGRSSQADLGSNPALPRVAEGLGQVVTSPAHFLFRKVGQQGHSCQGLCKD